MAEPEMHWHEVRFMIKLDTDPYKNVPIHIDDSPIHPFIANEILRPILESFEQDIFLWRFHRWFKPPKLHWFRLKIYMDKDLRSKITEMVQPHPLYQDMKKMDLLEFDKNNDISCVSSDGPNVKDDRDPDRPEEIDEIWPYYICGVSRAWLKLIEISITKIKNKMPNGNFEDKLKLYQSVNKHIEKMWVEWGGHAMLHHLNAVFGYKHINIKLGMDSVMNINPILKSVPTKQGDMMLPGFQAQIFF